MMIEPDEPDSGDESVWYLIIDYFMNTQVVLPNGKLMKLKGSVPSGSYFSQFVDTVGNYHFNLCAIRVLENGILYKCLATILSSS